MYNYADSNLLQTYSGSRVSAHTEGVTFNIIGCHPYKKSVQEISALLEMPWKTSSEVILKIQTSGSKYSYNVGATQTHRKRPDHQASVPNPNASKSHQQCSGIIWKALPEKHRPLLQIRVSRLHLNTFSWAKCCSHTLAHVM